MKNYFDEFVVDKQIALKLDFNPYYRIFESGLGDPVSIEGNEFINLASNNYLGLADDNRVKDAIKEAADRYGASLCGTPIATGYASVYKKCEQELADFVGLGDAVLFPSCYQANCEIFTGLLTKDDLVFIDHFAHASLVSGVKRTGCRIRPFLHNDMKNLEKQLSLTGKYKRVFVVTESVFSTEGSIAPFDKITELCNAYNAVPFIDDSHGIGVIGKNGKGILEEKGISSYKGIYVASLGKAIAHAGGMVAGSRELIDYIRYTNPGLIYSTALPPVIIAGILKVIEIIKTGYESLSNRMWEYKKLITDAFLESGCSLSKGDAPITSVICGSAHDTVLFAKKLFQENIITTPFIPPSVPHNDGRVRIIAGANLSGDSVMKAVSVFRNISGCKG